MRPIIAKSFLGPMASRSPRLLLPQLLVLLFVFAFIGPTACDVDCDPSEVSDAVSSGQVETMGTAVRGIKAALIHKDHHSLRQSKKGADKSRSLANGLQDDAIRSQKRSESLNHELQNERRLAENASVSTRSLTSQPVDWEAPLAPDSTVPSYYMEISLGTPPQTFVVVADTGSDLAWVQCLPGKTYYNGTNPRFDPSKSSTYANLSCAASPCEFLSSTDQCQYSASASEGSECIYEYTYGIGNTSGTLAEETMYIGTVTVEGGTQSVPKFQLGCAQYATESFGEADGLFGLGRGQISFPSQLGRYFGNAFSYCLVNRSRLETETSPLIFGDVALSPTAANGSRLQLQYIPMVNNTRGGIESFYYVDLDSITVNGVALSIPKETFTISDSGNGGFLFDSGTSYTGLLDAAFEPLVETLSSAIKNYESIDPNLTKSSGFELCYNATWEEWASEHGKAVPAVSFKFGNGATFELAVGNLWGTFSLVDGGLSYSLADGPPIVCMKIQRSDQGVNIFGNWQQMDYYIVYDLEKQQIGFAPAVCESLSLNDSAELVVMAN